MCRAAPKPKTIIVAKRIPRSRESEISKCDPRLSETRAGDEKFEGAFLEEEEEAFGRAADTTRRIIIFVPPVVGVCCLRD